MNFDRRRFAAALIALGFTNSSAYAQSDGRSVCRTTVTHRNPYEHSATANYLGSSYDLTARLQPQSIRWHAREYSDCEVRIVISEIESSSAPFSVGLVLEDMFTWEGVIEWELNGRKIGAKAHTHRLTVSGDVLRGETLTAHLFRGSSRTPILSATVACKELRIVLDEAREQVPALRKTYEQGECRPSPCFLTSAAVGLLGLPDDCWELQALRRFRDDWLERQVDGAQEIAEYYRIAPSMAARLEQEPQRLARLYLTYILPSAVAAQIGLNHLARALYVRMMRKVGDLG